MMSSLGVISIEMSGVMSGFIYISILDGISNCMKEVMLKDKLEDMLNVIV